MNKSVPMLFKGPPKASRSNLLLEHFILEQYSLYLIKSLAKKESQSRRNEDEIPQKIMVAEDWNDFIEEERE